MQRKEGCPGKIRGRRAPAFFVLGESGCSARSADATLYCGVEPLAQEEISSRILRRAFQSGLTVSLVLDRPGRSEPRAVKRRPKNFRLLTKPRHEMMVERFRKQSQKPSKHALNQAPFRTNPFPFRSR